MSSRRSAHKTLKIFLEEKKAEIEAEIISYPPPIPACDQQFNYLLEQRALIAEELRRFRRLSTQFSDPLALHEFVSGSHFINEKEAQKLLVL